MRFPAPLAVAGALAVLVTAAARAQHAAHAPAFDSASEQAAKLQLAPGFKLAVWAAEPQLSNGVAFHFDPRGRALIAESHRWSRSIFDVTQKTNWLLNDLAFRNVPDRTAFLEAQFDAVEPDLLTRDSEVVRLVEDRDGDGRADHSEILADGFNSAADGTAAGVLGTRDAVYFANIPNLWKLPANPAPDRRQRTAPPLATGFGVHVGVSGHDLHGLVFGPDGRLYMSFGDRGACITNREGRVIDLPDMGAVLRCEPDGSNLEVFCIGLRNPQELAFDDDGNLWTVDNDTAGADPCRVLHLVEDGDYGWRASYQHMEGFGPWVQEDLWKGGQDNVLPPAGTVSQGPSGLAFYPGTGFGSLLNQSFLHCDFPGGVWSYTVRPRGASFEVASKSKFLWNCWPTDVDFGPDGAAYVLDWVAGWGQPLKGRIYRITPATSLSPEETKNVADLRRILRDGLAAFSPKELLGLLGHPDRRARLEAQFELARRGSPMVRPLVDVALSDAPSLARRHALWGLGQIVRAIPPGDPRGDHSGPLTELLPLLLDPDAKVVAVTARLLGDAALAHADEPLARLLAHPDPAVRFAAAMGLGSLLTPRHRSNPDALGQALEWLERKNRALGRKAELAVNRSPDFRTGADAIDTLVRQDPDSDPFLRHAAVRHWIRLERLAAAAPGHAGLGTGLRTRASSPHPEVRLAAALALRTLRHGYLTNLLSDPDPRVIIAAGRALHDAPVPAGFPALASLLTRIDAPAALHSRVIDASFRLGTPVHAQTLAGFAKRRDVPAASRALALRALGDWPKPPPLDRVNGLWRPAVTTGRTESAVPETRTGNPLLDRASSAAGTARLTALPVLPDDLGRSTSFADALALKRNPEPARRAFLRVADEILNPSTPDEYGVVVPGAPAPAPVQLAVIDTAAALRTKEASQPLFELFRQPATAPEVRRAIVRFLAGINAVQTPDAVRIALGEPDATLRAAALPFLDRLEAGDAIPILRNLLQPGSPVAVQQAAYGALAKRAAPEADALIADALQRLNEGKLAPELHLDVLAAAEARQGAVPALKSGRDAWLATLPANDPIASRGPVLRGGDATRGGLIFKNHPQVQCLRCHKVGGDGGTVGPALDGIGRLRDRTYLLEAIVQPNKAYAEGFKPPEGGLSAMPEGLADLLTPLELRDLLEFLATLR